MITEEQIDSVLDERVRPYLKSHGGEVKVVSYSNGTVWIELTGACAGCPSADLGTRSFIEEELKAAFGEVTEVELHHTVSDELLEMARAILKHEER